MTRKTTCLAEARREYETMRACIKRIRQLGIRDRRLSNLTDRMSVTLKRAARRAVKSATTGAPNPDNLPGKVKQPRYGAKNAKQKKMETRKKTAVTRAKALENRRANERAMLMANSLNLLTVQIDRMIRAEMSAMGIPCKASNTDGDIIRGLRNYSEKAKAAMYWFERDLQNFITDSTFGSYGVKAYDDFNHSSAEVIQLVLLAIDRGEADRGMEKVFRALHRLKAGTRFGDEDIDKFNFKD